MDLLASPVATAEYLVVDTETNGRPGEACELTEVGAVLVGGGELHEDFASLVRVSAPLGRGIQRFTGITQAMVQDAPEPRAVLEQVARRMRGRVLVAHSAAFDRRVLRQAFERAGLEWPEPPVLCTVALARRLAPMQGRLALVPLARALGVEVGVAHRALPDARTCASVFCALFGRLCAQAATVGEALALSRGRRRRRRAAAPAPGRAAGARRAVPELDFGELPGDPGVYLFRDGRGAVLYVGKSVCVRSRARAHFAPAAPAAAWKAQAEVVDYRPTASELGALVLENRLIKELRPPGNRLLRPDERLVYLRCRLDIAFPVLEVAAEPAIGLGVSVGPLRGRRAAEELVEQLASLFALRHCGRALPRRTHPCAYGQMQRCLAPCLLDLDPNAYRERLDRALALFSGAQDGRALLLAHVEGQMRAAAAARAYERAAWLRRRLARLRTVLEGLDGVLRATHAVPRLVLARHPVAPRWDAFWLTGGRVADWGELPGPDELAARTERALRAGAPGPTAHLTPAEVAEARIVGAWLAARETPALALDPPPGRERLARFLAAAGADAAAARPLQDGGPGAPGTQAGAGRRQ